MNTTVVLFLLAGVLIVACALLREREVGDEGRIGRSRAAHLLNAVLIIVTLAAAAQTVTRLADLAFL